MKKILPLILSLISLSANASLETFFSKLEGKWENVSMEAQHETTAGEITTSEGTKFSATVVREGNRWNFSEDFCWRSEGKVECGSAALSYVVNQDDLAIIIEGEQFPVTVLENDDEHILIIFSSHEYSFMADLTLEGRTLEQNSVMEFVNGDKDYQFMTLSKH